MAGAPVCVHEMFHACLRCGTGFAAIAQIVDEARIMRGKAAELRARHGVLRKEPLDLAYQHGLTSEGKNYGGVSRYKIFLVLTDYSYRSRKNPSNMEQGHEFPIRDATIR
ncbi:MAG: hypothetical protein KGQ75_10260 [Sphingomonadales bacterium]|uniref:hypothetical protein n=1 Tax=Novosphingobium sp. NDB2Meth1 TaxID=1892847 RepID=UPI0015C57073|nr:hypothetical protein [Sphingomonadales bacterium]